MPETGRQRTLSACLFHYGTIGRCNCFLMVRVAALTAAGSGVMIRDLKTKNDHPWWSGAAGRRQRLGRKRGCGWLLGIVAGVGCYLLAALAVQVCACLAIQGTIMRSQARRCQHPRLCR